MATVRLVIGFILGGAILGVVIVCLVGPGVIEWWNKPEAALNAMCICADTMRLGAQRMIRVQLEGMATGAAVGLIAGVTVAFMRKNSAKAAAPKV